MRGDDSSMNMQPARIREILNAASAARIAVIGDLMLDTYIAGTASRLSQEAPVPVLHVRKRTSCPGGAANVMRNLKALAPSAEIFAFGMIGDDAPGRDLMNQLKASGVDVAGVVTDLARPTTEKQRVIAANQQVVRMDFEELAPIPETLRRSMTDRLLGMIESHAVDAIILEDYNKGLIGNEMLNEIADAAHRAGIFSSLDPHPGNAVSAKHLGLMTPNRAEAFALSGVYCSDPADRVEDDRPLRAVADRILETWEPELLLITLGHQGMALYSQDAPQGFVIPTIAREVFDVSGAGDTVISAYTLCKCSGADPKEAAMIANQAAGVVVGKAGTATTTVEEIIASLRA